VIDLLWTHARVEIKERNREAVFQFFAKNDSTLDEVMRQTTSPEFYVFIPIDRGDKIAKRWNISTLSKRVRNG
jgi:hypothetical protein